MREEVNQKFDQLILSRNKNDSNYKARENWYQIKKEEDLDSIDLLEAKQKKWKKRKFHDIEKKIQENTKPKKTILEFNCQESVSIKSFSVKINK